MELANLVPENAAKRYSPTKGSELDSHATNSYFGVEAIYPFSRCTRVHCCSAFSSILETRNPYGFPTQDAAFLPPQSVIWKLNKASHWPTMISV